MSIFIWAGSYRYWKTGDAWMLVVNTGTTIISYLGQFLIQNAQNRSSHESDLRFKAMNLKLDAMIAVNEKISNHLIGLENKSEEEIEACKATADC